MKKLMFAFCLLLAAAVTANAQAADQGQPQPEDRGEQIVVADLPAPVQQALASQDYSAWTTSSAHKKEKDGKTVYIVELKKGDEIKKVKFDEQGNKIKMKDKKDKDYQ